MSIILSLSKDSGDTALLETHYNSPIFIGDETTTDVQWEVSLVKLNAWYSYYNIDADQYQNNILTYLDPDEVVHNVVIPDGMYTVEAINNLLLIDLQTNGFYDPLIDPLPPIYIYPNYNTIKVELVVTDPTFAFDLSTSRLWYILCFDESQTAGLIITRTPGQHTANITNDINELQVRCSLLDGAGSSYTNAELGSVLYSFAPETPPGSAITVNIPERIYAPILTYTEQIRNVRVEITDQLGRLINFNGEDVSMLLHLRRVA
jgi:hypothetical protein